MQDQSHHFLNSRLEGHGASERHRKLVAKAKAKARRFDSIGHLGPEAVVAFVDGEMERKAAHRTRVHLVHCAECRAEIYDQRGTSAWVKQCDGSSPVRAPRDLMARLTEIAKSNPSCVPNQFSTASDGQVIAHSESFLDKMEMVLRAIKRNQGRK